MAKKKKEGAEKPLDKMTVTELRDIAKAIPDIVGVHGMNKGDLLTVIKEVRGIKEEKKTSGSVREIKTKIKDLKRQREEVKGQDKKKAAVFRRKIARLKKKSRQAA
jgi:hypothetical protein